MQKKWAHGAEIQEPKETLGRSMREVSYREQVLVVKSISSGSFTGGKSIQDQNRRGVVGYKRAVYLSQKFVYGGGVRTEG